MVFFAWKQTFGHIEASFDRSDDIFYGRGRKIVYSISENVKEAFSFFLKRGGFSSKRSDGNIEWRFENPLKIYMTKVWKI